MPEFYLVPKRLARKAPVITSLAQGVEARLFRLVFWLIRRLSLERALQISGAIFKQSGRLSDKAKKARGNLAVAFPEKSEEWREETTGEIFRSLGYSVVELIKLEQIWEQRDERLEVVLEPKAKEHMESKRATVFITAHVGTWQVAALITRIYGFTTSAIFAPESNPTLQALLLDMRQSIGERLIAATAGPRPLIRELKAGRSISMAMDTRPDTGKLIPFFGRDALSNTSAIGLALRTGASVVVAKGERLPNARYRITVYDPIISPNPEAPVKDQAEAMTGLVHSHFEDWIRKTPEQWICLKRRWPKAHRL